MAGQGLINCVRERPIFGLDPKISQSLVLSRHFCEEDARLLREYGNDRDRDEEYPIEVREETIEDLIRANYHPDFYRALQRSGII